MIMKFAGRSKIILLCLLVIGACGPLGKPVIYAFQTSSVIPNYRFSCRRISIFYGEANGDKFDDQSMYSLEKISSVDDDITEEMLQDIEDGTPPGWLVAKELMGINVFTYILAAAITFFFGMNVLLGPGWLGNVIGVPGTGTFTETSDALPDTLDLGDSKYLL